MAHPIQHFRTITRHRHAVIRHCFKAGIGFQGLFHDLSKYSPTEFIPGCKYYLGTRSPNEEERRLFGFSKAWLHHKGRNRHHFEYWTDYNPKTRTMSPVPMPKRYVVEMFCDRVAASKIYKGKDYNDACAYEYFLPAKSTRFIHPDTSDRLEFFLKLLADEGEDAAFRAVKAWLKEK